MTKQKNIRLSDRTLREIEHLNTLLPDENDTSIISIALYFLSLTLSMKGEIDVTSLALSGSKLHLDIARSNLTSLPLSTVDCISSLSLATQNEQLLVTELEDE